MATFMSRKKAKVPKMVAEGCHHSCQSPRGSPLPPPGWATKEALRTSWPQVRLSKREVRYSFMVSWKDRRTT